MKIYFKILFYSRLGYFFKNPTKIIQIYVQTLNNIFDIFNDF